MSKVVRLVIIFLLLISLLSVNVIADGAVPQDVLDSVESVVRIIAEYNGGYATGSGFVIQSDSNATLIATNHHVIEGNPKSISIWTESGSKVAVSIFVDDSESDLCILQFPYPNAALKALVLDKNGIKRGDAVYAVGFPGAADDLTLSEAYSSEAATITTGIISTIRTTYAVEGGKEFQLLQSTAPINHGNSGGPLFNASGYVVGVNTYSVDDAAGIYGAISISELIDLAANHGITVSLPEKSHSSNSPNTLYIIGASFLVLILTAIIATIILVHKKRKKKEGNNSSSHQTQPVYHNEVIEEKPTTNEQNAAGRKISTTSGPNDDNPVTEKTESPVESTATHVQISEAEPGISKDEILFENEPLTIYSGIPVLIEKVILTKSPQTGDLAAACSFRSLTEKSLVAMLIDIHCSDIWGNPTESVEDFQYLDLKTEREIIFGQDQRISIPNRATRLIEIEIKRVIYSDRTLTESGSNKEILPSQQDLSSFFGSEELKNEYIRETGVIAQNTITVGGGYWRCTCGAVNDEAESDCYRCGANKSKLLALQNVELISANLVAHQKEMQEKAEQERAEQEAFRRQAEEKKRLEKEERERKSREAAAQYAEEMRIKKEQRQKKVKRFSIIAAAVLLILLATYAVIWHIIPSIRYNNADSALSSKQFDSAYEGFQSLGSYKDSEEKAKEAIYQKACSLMNAGSFTDAAAEFSKVVNYKDSNDQEVYCKNQTAYLDAKELFDTGKYSEAAEAFSLLGDFSDSAEQVNASNYQYAKKLFDDGSFEEAQAAFDALADYEDSRTLSKESYYQLASKYFEEKEYKKAYDTFDIISRKDYKDSTELKVESCYLLATELFNKEEYEEAYNYFGKITTYKDSLAQSKESKYCQAQALIDKSQYKDAIGLLESSTLEGYKESATLLKSTQYSYAQQLEKKGKYSSAMDIFKKLGDYKDSKSKYLQTKYRYGNEKLESKSYEDAVSIFKDLGNYKDSKEKLKEAKYAYVSTHKNNSNTTTYEYLKDLKSSGYKDSKNIYNSLYAWSVTIVMNDLENNSTTNKTSISKYSNFYCHITLSGGPPNEGIELKYSMSFPDGDWHSDSWEGKWYSGSTGKCWGYYETPAYGATGTFRVKVYNKSTGELLGEASIRLT